MADIPLNGPDSPEREETQVAPLRSPQQPPVGMTNLSTPLKPTEGLNGPPSNARGTDVAEKPAWFVTYSKAVIAVIVVLSLVGAFMAFSI
ncbi:MAG: hypothetical protein ACYCRE_11815, partial [Acidobacteriaceae bacterium]